MFLIGFNRSFSSFRCNRILLADLQEIMGARVRRIRKYSTNATTASLVRRSTFAWKGRAKCDAKLKIFQGQKDEKRKKIMEGCFVQKESREVLKLVASWERHYARLLTGSHAIFYCTSSPRDTLNLPPLFTTRITSAKIIHRALKCITRILYCVRFTIRV